MLGVFGAVAVILAAVGLYSVLSTAVRQRTAEIGVRMAFGAPTRSIFQLIVGHGLVLSAIGVAVGIPAAIVLSRALGTALVNVSATDPLTYAVIAAGFLVVAAVSCGVPARRASKLDPLTALRQD
jgi:ABC-type antimicrobial peptide transport system permease subunit